MMKLSEKDIRVLVDEPYFSRGKEYVASRSVKIISVGEKDVKGKVVGNSVYSVKLSLDKSGLDGSCTCPAFDDFGPCKHLAALGLSTIAYHQGKFRNLRPDFEDDVDEVENFEKVLKNKNKNQLIAMIVQISDWYPDIRHEFME